MTFRSTSAMAVAAVVVLVGRPALLAAEAAPGGPTTAWLAGAFHVDVPGVVGRSDVVLRQPNVLPDQAMPLGNGALGVGVWAADGLTAQLNRADTLPDRRSPGQLVVPGLSQLTAAPDYRGRLDLYGRTFVQSGRGMTATTYVRADTDQLVVDVIGADPAIAQSAQLRLWHPRTPAARTSRTIGILSEIWQDTGRPGSSEDTFRALSAATAAGRDVRASAVDPITVQLSFLPYRDGSFRIVVAARTGPAGIPARPPRGCSQVRPGTTAESSKRTRRSGGTATGTVSACCGCPPPTVSPTPPTGAGTCGCS